MATELANREWALPSAETWQTMRSMAEVLVKSGLLPRHITTPEAAIAIMQTGIELGIPPMYAFRKVALVQGAPTLAAELMLALIYRDHGDDAVHVVNTTDAQCVIEYRRRTWRDYQQFTFTADDAKRAGLWGKTDVWNKYPAAMLRARCISALARAAFPDSIAGMYTPEELGASVTVTEDGETVVVEDPPPPLHMVEPDEVRPAVSEEEQARADRIVQGEPPPYEQPGEFSIEMALAFLKTRTPQQRADVLVEYVARAARVDVEPPDILLPIDTQGKAKKLAEFLSDVATAEHAGEAPPC